MLNASLVPSAVSIELRLVTDRHTDTQGHSLLSASLVPSAISIELRLVTERQTDRQTAPQLVPRWHGVARVKIKHTGPSTISARKQNDQ